MGKCLLTMRSSCISIVEQHSLNPCAPSVRIVVRMYVQGDVTNHLTVVSILECVKHDRETQVLLRLTLTLPLLTHSPPLSPLPSLFFRHVMPSHAPHARPGPLHTIFQVVLSFSAPPPRASCPPPTPSARVPRMHHPPAASTQPGPCHGHTQSRAPGHPPFPLRP
jgi:hypothetical protein